MNTGDILIYQNYEGYIKLNVRIITSATARILVS